MKVISLHFGLNEVDPRAWDGWNDRLQGCVNDAAVEAALAGQAGLKAVQLTNDQVTLERYNHEYTTAAKELEAGDVFYATRSGHGTELPVGEALVLWDGPLSDREHHNLIALFKPGVIVVLVDDTCYAAGMVGFTGSLIRRRGARNLRPTRQVPTVSTVEWQATVIQFAACRVTEEAAEDDRHGYLTRARQQTFRNGLTWRQWFSSAQETVTDRNPLQHPIYYASNPVAEAFLDIPAWTFGV